MDTEQPLRNKTLASSNVINSFTTTQDDNKYTITAPKKTGTIALLSDVVEAQTAGKVDLTPYATRDELANYATKEEIPELSEYVSKTATQTLTNKTYDCRDSVVITQAMSWGSNGYYLPYYMSSK